MDFLSFPRRPAPLSVCLRQLSSEIEAAEEISNFKVKKLTQKIELFRKRGGNQGRKQGRKEKKKGH